MAGVPKPLHEGAKIDHLVSRPGAGSRGQRLTSLADVFVFLRRGVAGVGGASSTWSRARLRATRGRTRRMATTIRGGPLS